MKSVADLGDHEHASHHLFNVPHPTFRKLGVVVKSVDEPSKIPREIGNWIGSISELHRSKPPASVHYRSALRNNRMVWGPYGTLIGSVSSMLSCLQGTPQGPLHKKLKVKIITD